jgi:hypothetical protein
MLTESPPEKSLAGSRVSAWSYAEYCAASRSVQRSVRQCTLSAPHVEVVDAHLLKRGPDSLPERRCLAGAITHENDHLAVCINATYLGQG